MTPKTIDLNSDMGEGYGPWKMGDDAALLSLVTSANIACGAHAGDPETMAATMAGAQKNGVGIGAHPGFADLQGFGRRRMTLRRAALQDLIRYQVGAAAGIAAGLGAQVRHVKLHGGLSNMASEDGDLARDAFRAARDVLPEAILMVLAGTPMQDAARDLGGPWAGEVFADRAYNADATLVDRALPGAILRDPAIVGPRVVAMVQSGSLPTVDGGHLPVRIDTICVHGDTAEAVALARAVRSALQDAGITLAPIAGRTD